MLTTAVTVLELRDALKNDMVDVNFHKFLRRGTNYGQPFQEGVLEDDGAERGGTFLLIGANQQRQFEFVRSQMGTDGNFISHENCGAERNWPC